MPAICPLCGADTTLVHQDGARVFRHCADCDLISVPHECHLSAEDQRARYARHRNSIADAGYVEMLHRPLTLLRQYGAGVRRVLDYGSGPAPVLVELLRREGYDAVGYDLFFADHIDVSAAFDAAVSVETFEHFAQPRGEIEKIAGLLRPDGLLIVMTLLHAGAAKIGNWWYARDATHVAFYSRATLEWIAATFGFEVLYCDNERLAALRRRE